MSQIRGKQIKDQSVVLDKLSGTGSVTFLTGAGMTFNSGSNLFYADAPTQGTEVANKDYVDSVASGLEVKESAQAISVSNIANSGYASGVISGVSTNLQIDGITILDGSRVVLNGQTTLAHNGIYVYDQVAGTLTRSTDMDEPAEVNGGEFVFIREGNTYADTGWVVSTPDGSIVIGTGNIQFTQFSSAGIINAGLGLLQTGNTFDIITGVGLTASANELKLDDTTVTANSYGSADTVSTFTVDQQGRLTAAGTATIDITASQVSDFATAVSDEVFDTANFVDSASVDFDVTAGATVSAYVKTDTTRGADINASGVFVKIDNSTITFDGSGNLQAVIPAATVTGASNGLDLSGTDVILGGTLSQNTNIDGDSGNTLNFTNLTGFGVGTTGELDLTTDTLDMNAGEATLDATTQFTLTTPTFESNSDDTDFVTNTFDVFADNSIALTATATGGNIDISAWDNVIVKSDDVIFNIGSDSIFTDNRTQTLGIRYAAAGYVTHDRSLTDKEYVDNAITNSTYFADTTKGLTLSGNTFSVVLDSDALQFTGGAIDLKDTIAGDRTFSDSVTINGNLTVSGTVSTVNSEELLVEDNVITLNNGEQGAGVTSGTSGIEIDRGTSTFAKLIFDETNDLFYAGLSGSLHAVVTEAGTGLTQSGNVLSIDTNSFVSGLDGVGLTANNGVLDVRATNGLVVSATSDSVELGAPLTRETVIDGATSHRFAVTRTTGMTFSARGGNIYTETTGISDSIINSTTAASATIELNTLDVGSDIKLNASKSGVLVSANTFVDVNTSGGGNIGITASGDLNIASIDAVYTDTNTGTKTGIKYANTGNTSDYVTDPYSLTTKGYVDDQISAITGSDIDEIFANAGLSGGGTSGNIDLAVEITTQGGLTFSASGNAGTLQIAYDSNTLNIVDGELTVIGGSAQPVYQAQNSFAAAGAPSAGADTGLSLTSTPNDYSRIEVYVNGQKQLLGGQGSFNETNSDCWFGNPGSATLLTNLTSGDKLYWNSVTAGFKLDTSDLVEIAYEA